MFLENFSLKELNTFGIEVKCRKFARFSSVEELNTLLLSKEIHSLERMILGGGSNILFTQDFDGAILHNEILGKQIIEENDDNVVVEIGAGEIWHDFVLQTLEWNLSGVENLSLIPGSVGASPMQNIGAYGVEIKDVYEKLEAYHIETGELHTFNKKECAFGYRESVFKGKLKGQYVITKVYFRLNKKPNLNTSYGAINDELTAMGIENPSIKDVSNAVIRIRQSKLPDPKEIGNAGSFFKNPVVDKSLADKIHETYAEMPAYPVPSDPNSFKLAAGWLIEKAGFKGMRIENHGVHAKQALVLVNYGGSNGKQIWSLSQQIIDKIQDQFGVTLEREVNII
jgi:UDP-N-acetylmuramate dehydrogenase